MSVFQAWLSPESIRFRVRALKARFRDQKVEFGVIREYLQPTDIACDIGANKGSFIYWLSRWCSKGRVIAFEPQPSLARRLQDICEAVDLDNVTIEPRAAYSHSGQQDLFVPRGHQPGASLNRQTAEGESFEIVSVPLVSLDEYFSETAKVGLLKIDAEGAELEILKGAERILRQWAPLLVFECENRHLVQGSVSDVFSYVESLGYEGEFVCHDQLLPISKFDAAIHQRQSGEWFWKSKDYCNNFVFRNTAVALARKQNSGPVGAKRQTVSG